MEEILLKFFSDGNYSIEEANLVIEPKADYWHSTVLDKNGNAVSGGFACDKMQARKIAVAEFLERKSYQSFSKQKHYSINDEWGLNIIPTACGFAAGFDFDNTIRRSIYESVERWVMSKWIDNNLSVEEVKLTSIENELDPISLYFISLFEEVLFFKKEILLMVNDKPISITVAKTMGLTKNGIFPGSSAQYTAGNIWHHALLESFRHLLFVKNNPARNNIFPDNKIRFFANNKNIGLNQIFAEKSSKWPIPSIIFHNCKPFFDNKYFIARTILSGWESWDKGPLDRFLY